MTWRINFVLAFVLFQFLCCRASLIGWGSTETEWRTHHPQCKGKVQSPINIEKNPKHFISSQDAKHKINFQQIYCNKPLEGERANTEHTINYDILKGPKIVIPLPDGDSYELKNFHFHWGSNNQTGSDHRVYNRSFPLEMHLVHYNTKLTKEQAMTDPSGLLVLSILFSLNANVKNIGLEKLSKKMPEIYALDNPKTAFKFENFCELFPSKFGDYFRYKGSLTMPPCSEVVTWIILTDVADVHPSQLDFFKKSHSTIPQNYRDVQPIGDRIVTHYKFDQ